MKNKVLQHLVMILCSESCWHLLSKSPHDFDSIRHGNITDLLSKLSHDLWNRLMILTTLDMEKSQTCSQNRLMILTSSDMQKSQIFFCDFPPCEPPWLRLSTINSPKSSLIITLWLTYHYNPNSSLSYQIIYPFLLFNFMVHFTLCYFSLILTSQ